MTVRGRVRDPKATLSLVGELGIYTCDGEQPNSIRFGFTVNGTPHTVGDHYVQVEAKLPDGMTELPKGAFETKVLPMLKAKYEELGFAFGKPE